MSGTGRFIEIESRLEVVRGLEEEKIRVTIDGYGVYSKYSGARWWQSLHNPVNV